MFGSRLYFLAVSLGTVAWGTSVSECQSILTDLSSDFLDTCAELCDFYGRKYPQICGNVDLIDCILQWHPEQCGFDHVPTKKTTKKPAATKKPTTKKLTTTTKKPTTTTKKPTTTTKKPTTSTKTTNKSATTKSLTTTTTTKEPTTTTTTVSTKYIYDNVFPADCVAKACRVRVQAYHPSMVDWCRERCDELSESSLCPRATSGEEFLMECVESLYPECVDTWPKEYRKCDFDTACLKTACGIRVKSTMGDDDFCRAVCQYLKSNTPADCKLRSKGDEALADCVVAHYGDVCIHPSSGEPPLCRGTFNA